MLLNYTHLRREVLPQHPILTDYTWFRLLGNKTNVLYTLRGWIINSSFLPGSGSLICPNGSFGCFRSS